MPVATESSRSHADNKMTLLATDDFWSSPTLAGAVPPAEAASVAAVEAVTGSDGGDEHSEDVAPSLSVPPAHRQLLSDEAASFERLKGHDHTVDAAPYANGYLTSASEDDDDEPSSGCDEKLSAAKQGGGGSWLLGLTRLERPASDLVPPSEEGDVPGLVRDSEDDSSLDSDESSSAGCETDDDDSEAPPSPARRRGVTFCESVCVQPVPHSSALSPAQRQGMYSSTAEVRRNKIRNKREYRYDGCDWRNVTEEWEMCVDMLTGELVHPAHPVNEA